MLNLAVELLLHLERSHLLTIVPTLQQKVARPGLALDRMSGTAAFQGEKTCQRPGQSQRQLQCQILRVVDAQSLHKAYRVGRNLTRSGVESPGRVDYIGVTGSILSYDGRQFVSNIVQGERTWRRR
jgi:hypothetical protein